MGVEALHVAEDSPVGPQNVLPPVVLEEITGEFDVDTPHIAVADGGVPPERQQSQLVASTSALAVNVVALVDTVTKSEAIATDAPGLVHCTTATVRCAVSNHVAVATSAAPHTEVEPVVVLSIETGTVPTEPHDAATRPELPDVLDFQHNQFPAPTSCALLSVSPADATVGTIAVPPPFHVTINVGVIVTPTDIPTW